MSISMSTQDDKELDDFVSGMLPPSEATQFLSELKEIRKGCGKQGQGKETVEVSSAGGDVSNKSRNQTSSLDTGRNRNIDEYRQLLHLSGRCVGNFTKYHCQSSTNSRPIYAHMFIYHAHQMMLRLLVFVHALAIARCLSLRPPHKAIAGPHVWQKA